MRNEEQKNESDNYEIEIDELKRKTLIDKLISIHETLINFSEGLFENDEKYTFEAQRFEDFLASIKAEIIYHKKRLKREK